MSSAKHTPGPWRVWRDQDPKEPVQICGMESDFVCEISGINTNREADARLIASAPSLLEELERLVARVEFEFGTMGWLDMAEAAINQAKGYK